MKSYKKSLSQVAMTIIAAVLPLLTADEVRPEQWVNVAILAVGAFSVFAAPNVPGAEYTKMFIAAATAALTAVTSFLTDGITQAEAWQVVAAFVGAILVHGLANDEAPAEATPDNVRAS